MKKRTLLWLSLSLSVPALLVAEPAPTPRIGKGALPAGMQAPGGRPVTDEELIARRQLATGGPVQALPPKLQDFSMRAMSVFLSFSDKTAILPKGCVLWCPDALQARVAPTVEGTVMPWAEFLPANRNWLAVCEITPKQARGEEPVPAATLASLKSRKVLVVATLNGLPVTVLPSAPSR